MNPLVSILIPVYNRVHLVAESIESARNQTYPAIEIIIFDNGSTDGTWELINEFALKDERIRVFQNPENLGPVRNWKKCIEAARGKYSKLLFSDDLISPNFIAETVALFDEETAFVLSKIEMFSEERKQILGNYTQNTVFTQKEYLKDCLLTTIYKFPISPGAALFRTSDLKDSLELDIENNIGLDFKKYGAGNDFLIFLNTAINYQKIKVTNKAMAYFRFHKDSFTVSNDLTIYYDFCRLYFSNKYMPMFSSKIRAILWYRRLKNRIEYINYKFINDEKDYFYLLVYFTKLYQAKRRSPKK